MMNIEQHWKNMNEVGDSDLYSLLQEGQLQKMHSINPLQKIKSHLLISFVWTVLIAALYVYVLVLFPFWPIIICIGTLLLFTAWGSYTSLMQYKNIRPSVPGSQPLLQEMEKNYHAIRRWMQMQIRMSIFIFPVGAAGGFMIGGIVGSGKSLEYFLSKPAAITAFIISTAILVPACLRLTKWMLEKSYGKHLVALKSNIDSLRDEQ